MIGIWLRVGNIVQPQASILKRNSQHVSASVEARRHHQSRNRSNHSCTRHISGIIEKEQALIVLVPYPDWFTLKRIRASVLAPSGHDGTGGSVKTLRFVRPIAGNGFYFAG